MENQTPWKCNEFIHVMLEMNDVSSLVGRLLTIVDASYVDKEQKEAVKTLVKKTVWEWSRDWHLAATEENIEWIENNCEDVLEDIDPKSQIEHYEHSDN